MKVELGFFLALKLYVKTIQHLGFAGWLDRVQFEYHLVDRVESVPLYAWS